MSKGQTREHSDIWSLEPITRTLHYMLFIMVRLISFPGCWFHPALKEISMWGLWRGTFHFWEGIPVCTGLLLLTSLPNKSRANSVGWMESNIIPCLCSLSVLKLHLYSLSVLLFIPFLLYYLYSSIFQPKFEISKPLSVLKAKRIPEPNGSC